MPYSTNWTDMLSFFTQGYWMHKYYNDNNISNTYQNLESAWISMKNTLVEHTQSYITHPRSMWIIAQHRVDKQATFVFRAICSSNAIAAMTRLIITCGTSRIRIVVEWIIRLQKLDAIVPTTLRLEEKAIPVITRDGIPWKWNWV